MAPPAAPSSNLKLTIGDIERKVDMSLDDIIKQSKEMGRKHRSKVKNRNRMISVPQMQSPQMEQPQVQQRGHVQHRREVQQRKDVLQRFVALRSSAIRQGKLEESRARNGSYVFVATKAAARQALSSNANVPLNQWSRYLQKPTISLGSGFVLGRGLSSRTFNGLIFRKPLQGTICPDGVAARNPKILGPHHLSK